MQLGGNAGFDRARLSYSCKAAVAGSTKNASAGHFVEAGFIQISQSHFLNG
jgi:hypothetical protein